MRLSTGVNVNGKTALAKSKISIIVFVSIVCRAAVEGGLSPEEAYGLGDSYIQMVESIENPSDLEPAESITTGPTQSIAEKSRSAVTISKCIWVKSLQRRCWRSGRDMPCTI